jgi:glycosyltransferase involved in cell wall biosynthesis
MNVLMGHNYYQQSGGEDHSFASEASLLEGRGHHVKRYTVHNDRIKEMNPLHLSHKTLWNHDTYRNLREIFSRSEFSIAHFQNTFPLISPSAYYAARDAGVPVVQSLRNYRISCVNGLFFRDGHVCEDCLGKFAPWDGVLHGCYRDSRAASGVGAGMLAFHKLRRTYQEMVDAYIALTEFSRQKLVEAGLPAEKIVVKPNFVHPDPGIGRGRGQYALFVGRLSEEKGLSTLLAAWGRIGGRLPLKIVGDGPLGDVVAESAQSLDGVERLGRKDLREVYELMADAVVLIFPSECYETFGRVAVEAFAKGTPVIAANLGGIGEIVEHGRTGFHFEPGNVDDLVAQVERVLSNGSALGPMRQAARAEYEAKYTAERNYEMLAKIYERAMAGAAAASS